MMTMVFCFIIDLLNSLSLVLWRDIDWMCSNELSGKLRKNKRQEQRSLLQKYETDYSKDCSACPYDIRLMKIGENIRM